MENWSRYEPRFRYMMLSRMKMDCDYYFGNGGQNPDALWAGNEKEQIENMVAEGLKKQALQNAIKEKIADIPAEAVAEIMTEKPKRRKK